MPKSGDIVHVGNAASVQFGEGRHLLFRVIRVMQPETQNTYAGWAWLEGYALNADGDAVERREIYIQPAGLRHADCTRGWDYTASLTPAERRADEEAMHRYCDEAAAENLGGQR